MLNKTFDTLNQTSVRLETILEVDNELADWQKRAIRKILLIITGILAGVNEKSSE
jgi:hypothetical protein